MLVYVCMGILCCADRFGHRCVAVAWRLQGVGTHMSGGKKDTQPPMGGAPSPKPRMCWDCHKGGIPLCDSHGTCGVCDWVGPPHSLAVGAGNSLKPEHILPTTSKSIVDTAPVTSGLPNTKDTTNECDAKRVSPSKQWIDQKTKKVLEERAE